MLEFSETSDISNNRNSPNISEEVSDATDCDATKE